MISLKCGILYKSAYKDALEYDLIGKPA